MKATKKENTQALILLITIAIALIASACTTQKQITYQKPTPKERQYFFIDNQIVIIPQGDETRY